VTIEYISLLVTRSNFAHDNLFIKNCNLSQKRSLLTFQFLSIFTMRPTRYWRSVMTMWNLNLRAIQIICVKFLDHFAPPADPFSPFPSSDCTQTNRLWIKGLWLSDEFFCISLNLSLKFNVFYNECIISVTRW
jgi:hypothetical protein